MDLLVRLLQFIRRNLFRDPGYVLEYAWRYLDPDFRVQARFMTDAELLDWLEAGKSLIRINDGEIYLTHYGNIHYQDYHPRLRKYLLRIIDEYDVDKGPYLIGIAQDYLGMSNREIRAKRMLRIWLPVKMAFRNRFRKDQPYFDAHLFYKSGSFERVLEGILKSHKVIFVTHEGNKRLMQEAGLERHLEVTFVLCPAKNSFDEFDRMLADVLAVIPPGREGEHRVLLAAGPASKALAYELSKKGIVSYDLGRGIEAVYRPNTIEQTVYWRSDLPKPGASR
jgi:hypothetical protein